MRSAEILFEAIVIKTVRSEETVSGLVDWNGVRLEVDFTLLPEVETGHKVLISGRSALAIVEENHEVCG